MKRLSFIISISIFLWSCSENKIKNKTLSTQKAEQIVSEINSDSTDLVNELESDKKDSVIKKLITNAPCVELQDFVKDIESSKWISDTARLNKVGIYGELNRQNIKYFNHRPFYSISFENSRLNKAYNTQFNKQHFDSLDFELFKDVKNIWGYFYRDKDATDWISDGVIEQWEFDSEEQADKALRQIPQLGLIAYFNTNPYFCRIRNKLIIFQSRASAFSLDQKTVFERFVKEKAPNAVYK
jgi:hypothetical protein